MISSRTGIGAAVKDDRGAALMEFALVAPVLVIFLLGAFDTAHTLYTRSVLQGVVQKAGRDSGLQTGSDSAAQVALDTKVRTQVSKLANGATITISRRFYKNFSDASAATPESFTDTNANGTCDLGEPFDDRNSNGNWDRDGADDGQGGAKDSVLYTVKMNYTRLFPAGKLIGLPDQVQLAASTILNNQPYSDQVVKPASVGNCR